MPNCFYFVLWAKLGRRSVQSYEKWSFFSVFSHFGTFPQIFRQVKEWLMLELQKIIRVPHSVAFAVVFTFFYDWSLLPRVFKIMNNCFCRVFSRLGPFPQVHGQLKRWPILKLHETMREVHIVAWTIVFLLFYEWDRRGGVFIVMRKDSFSVFLEVWVLFPTFLDRRGRRLH